MSDPELSQSEADGLLRLEKYRVNDTEHELPDLGGRLSIPLESEDKREQFFLDISRGRIELSKQTLQNRARKIVVLARLDIGGPPHCNPDGEEMPCPHLHINREGYGTKWAIPLPAGDFTDSDDTWKTLFEFMEFCRVTRKPNFRRGLFT